MTDVSVIVPVHDAAPWITECVGSLMAQTLQGFELIVVDDASTDGSADAARATIASHGRADVAFSILSHTACQGACAARLTGVEAATGCYLAFVDADDTVSPDFLARLLAAALAAGADVTCCGMRLYDGATGADLILHRYPGGIDAPGIIARYLNFEGGGVAGSFHDKLISRDLMVSLRLPGIPRGIYEDTVALTAVLLRQPRVAVVPDVLYHYRQHPAGTMGRTDNITEQLADIERNVNMITQMVEASDLSRELRQPLLRFSWGAKLGRAHLLPRSRQVRRRWRQMLPGLLWRVLFASRLSLHERLALLRRTLTSYL